MDMATVEMHIQEHRQTIEQHGFCIVGEPEHDGGKTRIQIGYADDRPHIAVYEFTHIMWFDCWRAGKLAASVYSAEEIEAIGMSAVDPFVPSSIVPILPSLVELAYGVAIQNGWMRDSTE